MRRLTLAVVVTGSLAALPAAARIGFQSHIPNGAGFSCLACHNSASGGEAEGWNVFGDTLFSANGGVADDPGSLPLDAGDPSFVFWDASICDADSDGDGATNGEELGDPDCVWIEGDTPARTEDITDPSDPNDKPAAGADEPTGGCSSMAVRADLPAGALALVGLALTRLRRRAR